jgi:hypothetical protein
MLRILKEDNFMNIIGKSIIMQAGLKNILSNMLDTIGGDSFTAKMVKGGIPMLHQLKEMGLIAPAGSRGEYYLNLANIANDFFTLRDQAKEAAEERRYSKYYN